MVADLQRHWLRTEVGYRDVDLQLTVGQCVGHLVFVRERPLAHQLRVFPELELAGDVRGVPVRLDFDHLPERGERDQAVDRRGSADVAQRHVESVLPAVGPERRLIQPVSPRREKRDSGAARFLQEFGKVGRREVQDVLPVHIHFVRHVPDRGHNGNFHAVLGIRQADDRHSVIRGLNGCVRFGQHSEGQR